MSLVRRCPDSPAYQGSWENWHSLLLSFWNAVYLASRVLTEYDRDNRRRGEGGNSSRTNSKSNEINLSNIRCLRGLLRRSGPLLAIQNMILFAEFFSCPVHSRPKFVIP